MSAEIQPFRCLSDNLGVLMRCTATGAVAAIDAPDADAIGRELDAAGWTLTHILITHRHADHVQGVPALKARYGATVIAPKLAAREVPDADRLVGEGDHVTVGNLDGTVIATPGHCDDHISYHFPTARALFCADTLFKLGCGRMFEGEAATFWRSLEKLMALPDNTTIYGGHDYTLGNARFAAAVLPTDDGLVAALADAQAKADAGHFNALSTLGEEKRLNPFLRAGEPAIAAAAGKPGRPPAEVFGALREWKNRF